MYLHFIGFLILAVVGLRWLKHRWFVFNRFSFWTGRFPRLFYHFRPWFWPTFFTFTSVVRLLTFFRCLVLVWYCSRVLFRCFWCSFRNFWCYCWLWWLERPVGWLLCCSYQWLLWYHWFWWQNLLLSWLS